MTTTYKGYGHINAQEIDIPIIIVFYPPYHPQCLLPLQNQHHLVMVIIIIIMYATSMDMQSGPEGHLSCSTPMEFYKRAREPPRFAPVLA